MGRVAFLIATIMEFLQLTEKRLSVRRFTDEPVAQTDLDYIMECVRMAPSACNRQPWRFVIVGSDEAKTRLRRCYDREWFASAPLYILCLKNTEENWVRAEDSHAHGDIDLAIATEHLCLAAAERGLGTCWVCNFNVSLTCELFDQSPWLPVAIIPIGHVAADCPLPEKKRKSIDDIVSRI